MRTILGRIIERATWSRRASANLARTSRRTEQVLAQQRVGRSLTLAA